MDIRHHAATPTHGWYQQPPLANRECFVKHRVGVQAQNFACLGPKALVCVQSARQRNSQRTFAATEGACPSEAALVSSGKLIAHAINHGSRSRMTDIARERVNATDVSVNANGSLVLTGNLDDVG
jgi:hypothetical protein